MHSLFGMKYLEFRPHSIMWALLSFLFFLSAQARLWAEEHVEQSLFSAPIDVKASKDVLLTVSIKFQPSLASSSLLTRSPTDA